MSASTLRSCHGTFVDFDKIYVFCDKCCVCFDEYVLIILKIKYVNIGRICDICYKVILLQNYTYFIIFDRHLSKYI